jgi:hypothetical protein
MSVNQPLTLVYRLKSFVTTLIGIVLELRVQVGKVTQEDILTRKKLKGETLTDNREVFGVSVQPLLSSLGLLVVIGHRRTIMVTQDQQLGAIQTLEQGEGVLKLTHAHIPQVIDHIGGGHNLIVVFN